MKRLVAGVLWFFAMWWLVALVASIVGVPDYVGPIAGLLAGWIVARDPRHSIWRRPSAAAEAAPA